jgi:ElaB/YqjD/DUF883 family membrane-anchored ribosome-binding protein
MSTTERGYGSTIDDVTERGAATIRETRAVLGEVASDARQKGVEARDSVLSAILDSVEKRPYTTLAIAGLIGFAYGALRRR